MTEVAAARPLSKKMAPAIDSKASARLESRSRPPLPDSPLLIKSMLPRSIERAALARAGLETTEARSFVKAPSLSSGKR